MNFGIPRRRRGVSALRHIFHNKLKTNNEVADFYEEFSKSNLLKKVMALRSSAFTKQEDRKIRQLLADFFSSEILEIADGEGMTKEAAARSKLRIDVRKWLMEQFAPDVFTANKNTHTSSSSSSLKPKIYLPDNGRS